VCVNLVEAIRLAHLGTLGEFRSSRLACEGGDPMDPELNEASAGAPHQSHGEETGRQATYLVDDDAPLARRPWLLALLVAPLVIVVLIVIAWAVDTSSRGVARNVTLASVDIGGMSEDRLAAQIAQLAEDFGDRPVELVLSDQTYTTTAGDLGLLVDASDTASEALQVGRTAVFPLRPFQWVQSFFAERQATLHFRVSSEQVATSLTALEGDDRLLPVEPTVELVDGSFRVVPGEDGSGLDPIEVAAALPTAADAALAAGAPTITVEIERSPIPPLGSVDAAGQAASEAEALVDEPIEVVTSGGSRTIESDTLRRWVRLSSTPDGSVEVYFDQAAVDQGLGPRFADVEGRPVDARITLEGGVPVIIGDRPGLVCCGPDSAGTILAQLEAGNRTIELPLVESSAQFTTADAESYRITQAVGGNNAWRDGAPTTDGPGFTTYHAAGGNRVANIHRIADLVRGAVVPPGESFSINDHVGRRTADNGFLPAGAISNGQLVDEIGGGISQFATTMFNAAYFAGLQIDVSQPHSRYFDRYPRGREATMGFPAPDLQFTNNTPYGILIWTSYTDTSITVTLYSSPYATAEQIDISESTSGRCAVVTTTRRVTRPDGATRDDKFRATYRPGDGLGC
jgi:vancomycin resistance protein YoaR